MLFYHHVFSSLPYPSAAFEAVLVGFFFFLPPNCCFHYLLYLVIMCISIFNLFHLLIAFVYSSHFLLKEIFLFLFSLKSCFLVSVLSVSAYDFFFPSSQVSNVDAPKQDYIFRSLYYFAYILSLEILSNPLAAITICIMTTINFYFLSLSL